MRRGGPLILVVMVGLLAFLGSSWFKRRAIQRKAAPHVPRVLPPGTESTASEWKYMQWNGAKPKAEIRAKDYREVAAPGKLELQGVDFKLYNKEATEYNEIVGAKADFDTATNIMYSEGEVSITLKVPVGKPPGGQLMTIKSSGVYFNTKTGKAWTDRATAFKYPAGEGTAVGASYDPQSGELALNSHADLLWRGKNPGAIPMHIETEKVVYNEKQSKVWLTPSAKMTRDTLTMNGVNPVLTIDKEHIRTVEAQNATGMDNKPDRKLDFAADHLVMDFDNTGEVSHILGERNGKLVSTTKSGVTTVHTDRIDLAFATADKTSTLQSALATGHSVIESHPAAAPGATSPPEVRVLKSDVIRAVMRPDGNEIDNVETDGPGTLEFIPVTATQPRRVLNGSRFWIKYGDSNQVQSFRTTDVSTRTDNPKQPGAKQAPAPTLTWSKELNATFQPGTSQLARLEQTHNFRYESGDRRAFADKAILEQQKNVITLNGNARVSDQTGATAAKQIVIDQDSGDFKADGDVNSTATAKNNNTGSMLSDDPVHARAQHMTTTNDNTFIRYTGNAVTWQGADRIQADVIEIDRENGKFMARGHVISQLLDKKSEQSAPADKARSAPTFTLIRAPQLIYTDDNRVAFYTGGVELEHQDVRLKSEELRAFLRPAQPKKDPPAANAASDPPAKDAQSSSLDHAFADGAVEVSSVKKKWAGRAEHAEYYVDEGKMVLTGGAPQFSDGQKGNAQGRQLTWYSGSNRLVVNGAETEQAHSLVQHK